MLSLQGGDISLPPTPPVIITVIGGHVGQEYFMTSI